MKKILKITCAMVLTLCMVLSSVVFVNADSAISTTVYKPYLLNADGSECTVNPTDSAFPSSVTTSKALTPTLDPSDFDMPVGMKLTNFTDGSAQFYTSSMMYMKASGYIIRVKSNTTTDFKIPIYVLYKRGESTYSRYQWGYVDWYVLGKDDTAWSAKRVEGYGITFDAGFDGYLYIPFDTLKNNGSDTFEMTDEICGINIYGGTGFTDAYFSLPVFVNKATLVEGLPSADKVVVYDSETEAETEVEFFSKVNPTTLYTTSFLNETGDGEYTVNPTDEAFPAWMLERGNAFTPTYDPTGFGLPVGIKYTNPAEGESTQNIIKFAPKAYSETAGFIIKIECDTETDFKIPMCVYYKNGEEYSWKYLYGWNDWYILGYGSNNWVASRVMDYGVDLPAGFNGYLYIPFDTLTADGVEWQDNFEICGLVINSVATGVNEATLSMPLFVDKNSLLADGLPSSDKVVIDNNVCKYFDYTTIYAPTFLNASGEEAPFYTAGNSSFPSYISGSNQVAPIADPSDFGLSTGIRYTDKDSNSQFNTSSMTYADASGYIMRVKSASDTEILLPVYILYKNGTSVASNYQWGYVDWYYMDKDDTKWTAKQTSNYGITLDAGFDGYIYMPFDTFKAGKTFTDTDEICGVFLRDGSGYESLDLSLPIFVDRATLKNGLPSSDKVIINGKVVEFFSKEEGNSKVYASKFESATSSAFTIVDDNSNFGLSSGFEFTNNGSATQLYFNSMSYADAAGYIIKVETDCEEEFKLPLYLIYRNADGGAVAQYQWGYVDWYVLREGDTQWSAKTVSGYGITLEAGFKGYVYLPFNTFKSPKPMTANDKICGFIMQPDTVLQNATFSVPMFVKRTTLAENGLPSAEKIKINGKELVYFSEAGDLDADGVIGTADMISFIKEKLLSSDKLNKKAFDANGDGVVDVRDLVFIKNAIASVA